MWDFLWPIGDTTKYLMYSKIVIGFDVGRTWDLYQAPTPAIIMTEMFKILWMTLCCPFFVAIDATNSYTGSKVRFGIRRLAGQENGESWWMVIGWAGAWWLVGHELVHGDWLVRGQYMAMVGQEHGHWLGRSKDTMWGQVWGVWLFRMYTEWRSRILRSLIINGDFLSFVSDHWKW